MDACIRSVSEETWKKFKMEAVRHGTNMGEFLNILVEQHIEEDKKSENAWERILKGKKTLTDKEAEVVLEASKSFRKNFDCK